MRSEKGFKYEYMKKIQNTNEDRAAVAKWGWGHENIYLTKDMIEWILDGGGIAWSDGEYTTALFLKENENFFKFDFEQSNNALIRALEERVAELERTARLLNDRDNPGSGSGRVSRRTE